MSEETRMSVELQESIQRTYAKAKELRPKNTTRSYDKRQQEFIGWCTSKGNSFNDLTRFTVTGEKLHLFLEECVIGRPKRQKSSKEQKGRIETIGRSSVNQYVAAMVDLWKQQSQAGVNSYPSPPDAAVSALLKLTQFEEDERKRKNFEDRGADTLLDGCTTTEQIQQIARYFWGIPREAGTNLRNLLAFLVSHYALMRGESARMLELADLHSITLENEGYSPCRAIVMVMRQGKTNQVGRMEVGACMRHKNVEICPHGLLALYLFWRWHVDGEAFPDFTSSERWYPLKLLKTGKDPKKMMSYKVHREAITAALKHVGIHSKAKPHVGRGSGSRMADLGGASESQIRRLGRWNTQAMEKCYLTSLPRETMRTLAGFEPSRGSFFVARASVDPPISLQNKIFPQVETWQQAIKEGKAEQSIAAGGFLELLQYLRKVVLQDAVFLQELTPYHPVWQHSIFASNEFVQFKRQSRESISTMEEPADQRLQKAMPVLKAKLDGVHQDLKASVDQVNSKLGAMEGNVAEILRTLQPLRGETATFQVKLVTNIESGSSASTAPEIGSNQPPVPRYKMRRGLESVKQLWDEWSLGVDGGTAVRELEERYGTKWCDADERRFFNRRRAVLDFVQQLSREAQEETGVVDSVATSLTVQCVDEHRQAHKKTLNWVSKSTAQIYDEVKRIVIARVALNQVAE